MVLKSTNEGKGEFGEVTPGWTVNEYVTPVAIGDYAGGSGGVSFSAEAKPTTPFVVSNVTTTTVDDFDTPQSLTGVINNVSVNGLTAAFSHGTALSKYDSQFNIPAMGSGGVFQALELLNQISGVDKLCQIDSGFLYTLRGHSAGFNSDGIKAEPVFNVNTWIQATNSATWTAKKSIQTGAIAAAKYFVYNNELYAKTVSGDSFSSDPLKTSGRINFKTVLRSGSVSFHVDGGQSASQSMQYDEGFRDFVVDINKTSGLLEISESVIIGGITTNYYTSQSLSTLNLNQELAVFVEWVRPVPAAGSHVIRVKVCNTSDYSTTVNAVITEATSFKGPFNVWDISTTGNAGVRAVYRKDDAGLPASGLAAVDINIVTNPDFASGTSEWTLVNSPTITKSLVANPIYGSNQVIKLSTTQTTSQSYRLERTISSGFIPGQTHSISMHKYNGDRFETILAVEQYDASNALIATNGTNIGRYYFDLDTGDRWLGFNFSVASNTAYLKIALSRASGGLTNTNPGYFGLPIISTYSTLNDTTERVFFSGNTADTAVYDYSFDSNGYSLKQVSLSSQNREYENQPSFNSTVATIAGEPVIGLTSKNGWEYLQDACAAYDQEIAVLNNIVTIRDVGTRILGIDNKTVPSLQFSNTFSGRNVEINYSNAQSVADTEIYNAYADGNKVLTVDAGERTVTTIETDFYPDILKQPTYSASAVNGVGEYKIISSDTATSPNISETLWRDYGGRLEVRVSDTKPNAIDVILTGPYQQIPGYTGPYKVAYTSGNTYAALSVVGSGVKVNPKTLKLLTGANPDKVLQDVAKTVNNPFISSIAQAYDRGIIVSSAASGPTASISFNVSIHSLDGFGVTAGSLVYYEDSIYRITDCAISGINVSINAVKHVHVGDVDAKWSGGTVGFFDELWTDHHVADNTIKPLWFIGDDEALVLLYDTDGNPYFAFAGISEFSVYLDEDGAYYEMEGGYSGDVDVFLDTDFKPYAGG